MKRILQQYTLVFLLLGTILPLMAQNGSIRQQGYWTLGLNGGWAYQQSDAQALVGDGRGFGLTLGKNLYYRPGAALSFDLRGRFLYANMYGLDGTRTEGIMNNSTVNGEGGIDYLSDPGFVYYNHNTKLGELGLEGVFHLNRLRERTNWDISLFGGIGLDLYSTKNDWLKNGGTYGTDFANLDANASVSSTRSTLSGLLDGDYETRADGFDNGAKLNFMPDLGLEAYYWLTPRFALGAGHKVTFTTNDVLDGQMWTNGNTATAENDIYHYTSLGAKWIIEGGRRMNEPLIQITEPSINPYTSSVSDGFVKARIKHVNNPNQVSCKVNGRSTRFDLYGENFSTNFPLRTGRNEVVIYAKNEAGSDQKSVIIIWEGTIIDTPPPPPPAGPIITYINPPRPDFTANRSDFQVEASVENVRSQRDIAISFNGRRVSNFNFDQRTGRIRFPVTLRSGRNDVVIRVRGASREAEAAANIYLEQAQQRPTVRITQPRDRSETNQSRINVSADLTNVESKYDIKFILNGRVSNSFQYDNRGRLTSTVNLKRGRNTIRVEASNRAGQASDEVTVTYDDYTPPVIQQPSVRITNIDPPRASDCRTTVNAVIQNIDRKGDISFTVNGQRISNFNFNPSSGLFTSSLNVDRGRNEFVISARNSQGRDEDRSSVTCSGLNSGGGDAKPTVDITQPSQQSTTTNTAKATVKAKVGNVTSKSDITVYLNGQRLSNFTYSTSSKIVTANVDLKSGNNEVLVRAKNKAGQAEDGVAIRYIRQVDLPSPKPPTVKITAPANNSATTTASSTVKATITNISTKTGITLTVNGKSTNFSYTSGKLSAPVSLKEGNNSIKITVKNSDGQDSDAITVKYNKPVVVPKPTVSITSPGNNSTVQKNNITVKATIKNAKKNEVTYTLNGTKQTNFTLSGTSFSAPAKLKNGRNTILIKATNAGGTASQTVTVNYKAPASLPKPTVKFTQPSRAGSQTDKTSYVVKAIVNNIKGKAGIVFTVNGKQNNNFIYDARAKEMKATITLKEGKNTFSIKATNASGSTTEETNLTLKRKVTTPSIAKPVVKIESVSQPIIDPMDPNPSNKSTILAKITGVTDRNAVTLLVNGKKITNFDFTARGGTFKAVVSLSSGENKIILRATNKAGSGQDTTTVNY